MRKKNMAFGAALGLLFVSGNVPASPWNTSPGQSIHYSLTIEVRPSSHAIVVHGVWTVPAKDVVTSAGEPSGKTIHFVSSEKLKDLDLSIDGQNARLKCQPADGQLECDASFSASARSSYTFNLSYRSDGKPVAQLRIDADQAFAGSSGDYWYPQLSFSQAETADLRFIVPQNFVVVAPGKLINRQTANALSTFEYRTDVPVKLGFAAAPFHIYADGMCSIYFQQDDARGRDMAKRCGQTAAALTRIWGPFPSKEIKLVEVNFKGILLGVGESGYILADSSEMHHDFDITYWGHEMSHQWWGGLVHAKYPSPGNTLLTEGMAEFGSLSVNRELNGPAGETSYLSDSHANDPSGAPLYHFMSVLARHQDVALTAAEADSLSLHYVATSKGAMAIDLLAREIGTARFRAICAEFLKAHAYGSTTFADFEKFIELRTHTDLNWFYTEWFDRPGIPLLYADWKKNGDGIDITLHQCGRPYRLDKFPFRVRRETENGVETDVLPGSFSSAKFTIHLQTGSGVYSVTPDPDRTTLWLPGMCD